MTERSKGRRMAGVVVGLAGLWAGFCLRPAVRAAEALPAGEAPPAAASGQAHPSRPQTVAEIIPAPCPAAENAAPLFMEAITALEAEKVWDTNLAALAAEAYGSGYGAPAGRNLVGLVESLHLPAEGNRAPTVDEVCEEFARQLQAPAARRALALCAQAASRPRCWFALDYSQGPNLSLPHLAKLRNLARFLVASAYVLAEHDDAPTAWECIVQPLRLADLLRDEPLLITQLVRIAILRMSVATLQEVTALALPSPELRHQLDALLDRLDEESPWAAAMDGERLLLCDWVFAQPPEKIGELLKTLDITKDAPALTAAQLAAEHAAGSAILMRLADLASQPYYRVKDDLAAVGNPASFADTIVVKATLPALVPACAKMAECQAGLRVTRIGLRLKAQRAQQGTYPATLEAALLADIPPEKQKDPFTGKALCYRQEGDGFVLYSVGPDGTDDGGKPRVENAKQGFDVVWRATP